MKKLRYLMAVFATSLVFNTFPAEASTVSALKSLDVTVDGNKAQAGVVYEEKAYVSLEDLEKITGAEVVWDKEANSVNIVTKPELEVALSNHSPIRSEMLDLTVSGEGFEGLPYSVSVCYKTTRNEYEGVVGTPLQFKVGSATPGFTVIVYINVKDEANDKNYELVTSFTPTEKTEETTENKTEETTENKTEETTENKTEEAPENTTEE